MAVKKKKKATRKKSSKIVKQSNNSNELIEKIKANPLIALIGIAIVVGIGIFIYSSQQGTQIALNNCINKNLNSKSNINIDENLLVNRCIQKHQKKIPASTIKISKTDDYRTEYNDKCIESKITDKEVLKRYKSDGWAGNIERFSQKYGGKHPECTKKIFVGIDNAPLNPQISNYLVTEIGYTNGQVLTNLWLLPGETLDNTKTDIKIKYVKGVKITLK